MLEPEPSLTVLVGYRIVPAKHALRESTTVKEWLICNGINMGRWTSFFGANCLADIPDCKEFLRNKQEEFPDMVTVEYKVEPK